jgi:hypothetical protein
VSKHERRLAISPRRTRNVFHHVGWRVDDEPVFRPSDRVFVCSSSTVSYVDSRYTPFITTHFFIGICILLSIAQWDCQCSTPVFIIIIDTTLCTGFSPED